MSITPPPSGSLFAAPAEPIARARRTDPETSRDAAKKHNATGKAHAHMDKVIAAVAAHPRKTSAELAELIDGLDLAEVRRRLSDAKRKRRVFVVGARACSVTGTRQSVFSVEDPE